MKERKKERERERERERESKLVRISSCNYWGLLAQAHVGDKHESDKVTGFARDQI
jgi:hypothetical protein